MGKDNKILIYTVPQDTKTNLFHVVFEWLHFVDGEYTGLSMAHEHPIGRGKATLKHAIEWAKDNHPKALYSDYYQNSKYAVA